MLDTVPSAEEMSSLMGKSLFRKNAAIGFYLRLRDNPDLSWSPPYGKANGFVIRRLAVIKIFPFYLKIK